MDQKARVIRAVENYHKKQLKTSARPKRKNKSPEKDVQTQCVQWMEEQGFSVHILEAKATFNPKTGGYHSRSMASGISDLVGNDKVGNAVFIEFKAPGKLRTLRDNQREFILKKIETNAFALVTDSVEHLKKTYMQWKNLSCFDMKQKFLRQLVPKAYQRRCASDDDLPW